MGDVFDLEEIHFDEQPRNRLFLALDSANNERFASNMPNIKFYNHLLQDDQRISKMDLEYWMDYVYLFGVKELIPLYDGMDPITYRNWDVYILNWCIFFCIVYFWKKVISFCCCGKSEDKKVKTE